jgi:hypothetical protein
MVKLLVVLMFIISWSYTDTRSYKKKKKCTVYVYVDALLYVYVDALCFISKDMYQWGI